METVGYYIDGVQACPECHFEAGEDKQYPITEEKATKLLTEGAPEGCSREYLTCSLCDNIFYFPEDPELA